jgi:hypothetical protein
MVNVVFDRVQWRAAVDSVMNFFRFRKGAGLFDQLNNFQLLKADVTYCYVNGR